jgi:hypothetical protein
LEVDSESASDSQQQVRATIRRGIRYLHSTRRELGWGHTGFAPPQLPSTAVAVSTLLAADLQGFSVAVRPTLDDICAAWRDNLVNGRLIRQDSHDFIQYVDSTATPPLYGQAQVPYLWWHWTLLASTLLRFEWGVTTAYEHIRTRVMPHRDETFPWHMAKSAFAMMKYLEFCSR